MFVSTLLAFLAIGAALPVLPTYVRGPLRAGDVAVGIVVGAFAVTAVVCRPLAGRQADARGRRAVLVAGALAMALGGALYLLSRSVAGLVAARLVVGAGEGAVYTAGATWAVDLAPEDQRGLALGLFGLAVWGGLSLGPLAGELLRSGAGYDCMKRNLKGRRITALAADGCEKVNPFSAGGLLRSTEVVPRLPAIVH